MDVVSESGPGDGDAGFNDAFLRKAPPEPANWSRRYKQNIDLLQSGELAKVALVAHRLEARARDKGLSAGEQRMLERARSILECEAFLGLPDGLEGDEPDDGGPDVREPRGPKPTGGAGPQAINPPHGGDDDRADHLDQR